jgi:ferredoxin-type protein NapG
VKPQGIIDGGARNRRKFLADTARTACSIGIAGLALAHLVRGAQSRPANAVRPPGAGADDRFLSTCVRCGLCVNDCPYPTLRLARIEDDVAVGTPYFVARDYPCEMCDDIPCVAACPTGALDKRLTSIDDARMGLAVLTDKETCLNFLGLRCDVCYRVCPLMGKAITLEYRPNRRTGEHAAFIPTVHSDACTGCGKCEHACVLEEAAIKVLPGSIAKGRLGSHYRLGWQEKERKGEALVKGITDLPDRMPEGRP